MSQPFYVAPEQVMKDRADYARKGIARGRALVGIRYTEGIAIVAENPSETLRKVSEIYDRIAFAGVGRYNEFDQLRVAGIRAADLKGYQYSRDDVDARSLANQFAQILGNIFTHEMKPLEVEILVAEVGGDPAGDQMFHILYDGTVMDERQYSVLGGDAEVILDVIPLEQEDGGHLSAAHPHHHAAATLATTAREPLGLGDRHHGYGAKCDHESSERFHLLPPVLLAPPVAGGGTLLPMFFWDSLLSSLVLRSRRSLASASSRTTRGVRKTRSSVLLLVLDVLLKSSPRIGMSPSNGTLRTLDVTLLRMMPPRTIVSPSFTDTVVSAWRWLMIGALNEV